MNDFVWAFYFILFGGIIEMLWMSMSTLDLCLGHLWQKQQDFRVHFAKVDILLLLPLTKESTEVLCIFIIHTVHVLGNILLMSANAIVEHLMTKCYIFL